MRDLCSFGDASLDFLLSKDPSVQMSSGYKPWQWGNTSPDSLDISATDFEEGQENLPRGTGSLRMTFRDKVEIQL